jgi:hypothetical protein
MSRVELQAQGCNCIVTMLTKTCVWESQGIKDISTFTLIYSKHINHITGCEFVHICVCVYVEVSTASSQKVCKNRDTSITVWKLQVRGSTTTDLKKNRILNRYNCQGLADKLHSFYCLYLDFAFLLSKPHFYKEADQCENIRQLTLNQSLLTS